MAMTFQELSEQLNETKRVHDKIHRGEKLTPEEEEFSLEVWPLSVRCTCCGIIPKQF
ncbi:hypothetical protein K2Q00_01325 [Patescibacteria group bacterium]|nr:hypothetical protein [Patescibacteria group bacterium]